MRDCNWRDAEAYTFVETLPVAGIAWEFLRRNTDYRTTVDEGSALAARFGLSAYADPQFSAAEQPIFWRPAVSPRTLVLTSSPANDGAALTFDLADWPGRVVERACADGVHLLLTIEREEHRLCSAKPLIPGQRLVVALPLDADFPIRAEAAARLFEQLSKRGTGPPKRGARYLARRLAASLRALDARAAGASQRQIAAEVLGARFVGPRAWEDSAARAMICRLLRHGAALVAGGYLTLLARN
jgi:hypothetical protein